MASNSFGNIFRLTSFGESHGAGIGVVIDGIPAGLQLDLNHLQEQLRLRAPGRNAFVSPRSEADQAQVLAGLFEGKTTGAPLAVFIANANQDSSKYEQIKDLLRPGHANYSYLEKYGIFDHRGGGRASARETAARVVAGAIAKQFLAQCNIEVVAYLQQVEELVVPQPKCTLTELKSRTISDELFCPDPQIAELIKSRLLEVQEMEDSAAGIVAFRTSAIPAGLGEPIYEKLEANLAKAMLSIPATKGFEIGEGFNVVQLRGSSHNDSFMGSHGAMASNHHGGTLGGISTGAPIYGRVAFKPTASIKLAQNSTTIAGDPAQFKLPEGSKHDPCVAIRGVAVVEAMLAIVLFDHLLMSRTSKLASLLDSLAETVQ